MVRDDGRMELGVEGRTAVVTGASRGIGAAVAGMLEGEGARVVRVSRGAGVDITAADAAERVAELAGGPVDILVNNAGTSFARDLLELTDDDWRGQWELNVMGALRLMRHFAPRMAERGWGRIVTVASSAGKRPSLTNAAYSVTKAAQLSLSRGFADVYAERGVLVNAVTPSAVSEQLIGELRDRPLSVMRALRGQKPFMQKNVPKYAPPWVQTVTIWAETSKRDVAYALCNDRPTLLWFANQRAVEYHPTLFRLDPPDNPQTHLVLDVDPPPGAPFEAVVGTARLVREVLAEVGLASALKTSGAKG